MTDQQGKHGRGGCLPVSQNAGNLWLEGARLLNIPDMRQAEKTVFAVLIGITVLRLVAIMLTPLAPDVEETQYWLWSQTPDAGYFTKPPMIAWVIGLTTAIAGNGIVGMKLAAP